MNKKIELAILGYTSYAMRIVQTVALVAVAYYSYEINERSYKQFRELDYHSRALGGILQDVDDIRREVK